MIEFKNGVVDYPLNSSKRIKYFISLPFIGKISKTKRNAFSVLRSRDIDFLRNRWETCGANIPEVFIFLRLIRYFSYMKWPNYYFVPEDKAYIVLGYFTGVNDEAEDCIVPICKMFGITIDDDGMVEIVDSIFNHDCTILDFWRLINRYRKD